MNDTGNAINAKSEALEVRELSSEELNAVSGGFFAEFFEQMLAATTFSRALQDAGRI
jgi:hypothetical protein